MDHLHILMLSFIQGLTEFLPISSSGHLLILPSLLKWNPQPLIFDVAVHMGTLLAVLVYYRADILLMTKDLLTYIYSGFSNRQMTPYVETCFKLMIATLPIVFVGLFLKKYGMDYLRMPQVVIGSTIVFGILMAGIDYLKPQTTSDITYSKALFIGLCQIFSLIPGASRSGTCLIGARLNNVDRTAATKFSFLLSIPVIAAAGVLTTLDALKNKVFIPWHDLIPGIIYSFIFGLAAIHFMIRYVQNHSLLVFGLYRIILGCTAAYFLFR